MRNFHIGEKVKITQDFKRFRNNRHSYNDEMIQCMGKETNIINIDAYNDVINVADNNWNWDTHTIEHLFT